MATIKDVANKAGVSVATVSRAINGSGYVSKQSLDKINKAIQELDFSPNEVARSLYQKKSKLVGLLLPDISNPFFPLVAKGVEDNLHQKGYQVILGNVQENKEKAIDYLKIFEQNNVAGVLSAVNSEHQKFMHRPFVMLDRVDSNVEYAVYSDDLLGGELAAKAMLAAKPKVLVVVSGPEDVSRSKDRLVGVEYLLKKEKQPYHIIKSDSFLLEDAEKTAKELFYRFPDVDSVIAPSDIHAIALIQEANRCNKRVPEDFQIIGYDDIPISNLIVPRLTTIHQPAYKMGWQGAEMLYQLMNNQIVKEKQIVLPVYIEKRETLRKKELE